MERRMCSGRDGGLDTAERNDIRFVTEITPWEVCDWKLFCISSVQLRILVASKIARTEFEYNVFLVLVYFFYISIISNENSITSISILIIQLWSSLMNHFDKIRQSMNIIQTYVLYYFTYFDKNSVTSAPISNNSIPPHIPRTSIILHKSSHP